MIVHKKLELKITKLAYKIYNYMLNITQRMYNQEIVQENDRIDMCNLKIS